MNLALLYGLASPSKGVLIDDFRAALPAAYSYSRTGNSTALSTTGAISTFAADVAPITNRGMLVEATGQNLFTRWAPTVAQLSVQANASDVSAPANAPILGLNWLNIDNTSALAAGYAACSSIPASTAIVISMLVETPDGSQPVFGLGSVGTNDFSINMVSGNAVVSPTASYERLTGNVWRVVVACTSPAAGASTFAGPIRPTTMNKRALKFSGFDIKLGTTAQSPIPTTGAAATRGLPTITRAVPAGRTIARATYGTANTVTDITGLTPGASFDLVTGRPWTGLGNELKSIEWR
jgi:hypothetical protein